jgi:hypothetical protein
LDFSVDGMRLRITGHENTAIQTGASAKVISEKLDLEALAKIIWVDRNEANEVIILGLRYLKTN